MPQGGLKKPSKPTKGVRKSKAPKKAAPKQLAPRRQSAIKEQKLVRKGSGALTVHTEKQLASKVGHLELLKGNRRELEKQAKAAELKKNQKGK